jgi:DNA-binding response OmpR family regulator
MNNYKKLILVVEDDKLIAGAIEKKLAKSNFEVIIATDGKEGLDLAIERHPDLILLDIILPVMDGISLLDKLRGDSWGAKVPVIILSNLTRAMTPEEMKEKGVSLYLIKTDWKLEEVVNKVKYELGLI